MYKPRSPGGKLLQYIKHKPNDDIYLIAGHATDNPKKQKKIPKGCKYCTFAECGLSTISEDPRIVYVEKEFMKGNPMFKIPTSVNDFLHKISKQHRSEINSISEIRNTKSSISIKNYSKTFQRINENYTAERARHTYSLSQYNLFSYNNSNYSIDDLCTDLTACILDGDVDDKFIKKLFDNLNFILEYSGIIKFTEEPREPNKRVTYDIFPEDDFDFFYDLFIKYYNSKDFKYIDENDINKEMHKLIDDIINTSNKDLTHIIKETFKYSFFPSVDMVLEFYETTDIRNIFDFKYEFRKHFLITQEDLFEYLPGMYYNFICRNTDYEEKAMERRKLSPLNPLTRTRKSKRKKNQSRRSKKSPTSPKSPKSPKSPYSPKKSPN